MSPSHLRVRAASRRRGAALAYVTVTLLALIGFCSLAVDLGRVQAAKGELRLAADAAARYGAGKLADGPSAARAAAVAAAADNAADGVRVGLNAAQDVQLGTWDEAARSFTPLSGAAEAGADAVRVTARRTGSRGNAVPLLFAGVLGKSGCDVTASAVARAGAQKSGIVGLDSVKVSGNTTGQGVVTDSYSGGVPSGGNHGSLLSNGDITIGGTAAINGDARPGPGRSVSVGGNATVTGSTQPLAAPLYYPMPSAGTYATANDNASIPAAYLDAKGAFNTGNASVTLPGGVYYLSGVTVGSSGTLTLTGKVTLYVNGDVSISGRITTAADDPHNLRIVVVKGGTNASLGSGGTTYAEFYCPGARFSMGGGSSLCGSVVGKTVEVSGSARILIDEALKTGPNGVQLVQ